MAAMGVVTYNPGTGNSEIVVGLNADTETIIVQSGNGIRVGAGGVDIVGNMYIGLDYSGTLVGQLYAETTTDSNFAIISDSDINVDGSLNVYSGKAFDIHTVSGTINASFGSISNTGTVDISDIGTFLSGQITSTNNFSISANQITAGAVANNGGDMTLTSAGVMTLSYFDSSSAGVSTLNATTLNIGDIQNNTGTTNINLTGNLISSASIENSGILMDIEAANVTVAGTMKNDNHAGSMNLNVANLTVNGGDISNASFVNTGDFTGNVSGTTHFAYGFDLSGMNADDVFSLNTGTLTYGAGWTQIISNNLNQLTLTVNNGDIVVGSITNGAGLNTAANMDLTAGSIQATFVQNDGNTLNMTSTDSGGEIYLTSGVTSVSGSTTNMVSAAELNIAGAIINNGSFVMSGSAITLNSITNTGTMDISSTTGGSLNITSNITNGGTIDIDSSNVNIDGNLININGATTIIGSTLFTVGSIDAQGGVINLDSGSVISVDNNISVTGGGLNFGSNTDDVNVVGGVSITGNLTASATPAVSGGNVNVAANGVQEFLMHANGGNIDIGGNVSAVENDVARTIRLDANIINVTGNIVASNQGRLIFGNGSATNLNITGSISSTNGGLVELNATDVQTATLSGNGKFIAQGTNITATQAIDNAINISNGVWFDGTNPTTGFVINTTNDLTLETSGIGGDILVAGGVSISSGNKLTMNSIDQINISGLVNVIGEFVLDASNDVTFANNITDSGIMNINTSNFLAQDITNSGMFTINSDTNINVNDITNSGDMIFDGDAFVMNNYNSTAGGVDITADSIDFAQMSVSGGYTNLNSVNINTTGDISVTGNMAQGGTTGMLNITQHNSTLNANNLTVGGDFNALQYTAIYNLADLNITGDLTVSSPADVTITANLIATGGVNNSGNLVLNSDDISLGNATNSGYLEINTDDIVNFDSFATTAGSSYIVANEIDSVGLINLSGGLLQNSTGTVSNGDANVTATDLVVNALGITASNIYQESGTMVLNTSDLDVGGNIDVQDLQIVATGPNWLTANITGDVNGNVDIIGLQKMVIGGDYLFDDNSMLHAVVLPRATTAYNYWSTVSLANDNTLGQITNGVAAEPLISINGKFISNITALGSGVAGPLDNSQFGLNISDIVNPGTAIWLLHADGGLEELGQKNRNLYVKFCNADGSMCYNYLDALGNGSSTTTDLPVYLSSRDTDGDGEADSLYVVFDPRFGGPVEVFKIQPIVENENYHTDGEYSAAGALDDLIASRLAESGFFNRTPIETIPVVFDNTYLENAINELYARMEQYQLDHNGYALTQFSRLFQPREIDQVMGNIALNEHASSRDFEDHMFDEFIWNRFRSLKKSWMDVDFGMLTQQLGEENRASGNRFSLTGGFDWKDSATRIIGLSGRISRTSNNNVDNIDLTYKQINPVQGRVNTDVNTTSIGFGGYLMQTLNENFRMYGNVFADLYMFDVSRQQNFVQPITGSGSSFGLVSEVGLMHDLLNQYIVGNLYARASYNSGFVINEKSGADDYMKLQSDGYFALTPGYSLTAQKRIYASPWFQIRPSISIGAEYDVLGLPNNSAQFKFAMGHKLTDYQINFDPLWATAGGGVEFLSANGWQFGIDYRYQYNADMQMHKIKLSGSYRF